MGDFKWLQFSDLHFSTRERFDTQMARRALLSCLGNENFECDYVFITGDIANQCNYDDADKHIADILGKIGITQDKVFWAVGNHDIKRRPDKSLRSSVINAIRTAANPSAEFDDRMGDAENRALLTQIGMSDYIKQYELLLSRKLTDEEILDSHVFYDLEHCNLVVLNTCLTSCDNKDNGNLLVLEPTLLKIFDKTNDNTKPLIVIGHHDKVAFHVLEQTRLAQLFDNAGVDLYLCGHMHQLGYARFDDAGRDIPQITCGHGTNGDNTIFSFMYGEYDSAKAEMRITPYSYSDKGARLFTKDFSLHRRLLETNNTFVLQRLVELSSSEKTSTQSEVTLQDADLFDRSQSFHDFLRSEKGRFSYLEVQERLFPIAKRPEVRLQESNSNTSNKLQDVLRESEKNLLILGDGGMGKTTALLSIWDTLLKSCASELPLYVPLNEYKGQAEFIRNYVKQYYAKTDIVALNRPFVLLLDGLNETSGDTIPLVNEIKDLMNRMVDNIRVIVTSRTDFKFEHGMADRLVTYQLQLLDIDDVKSYLTANNRPLDGIDFEVLRIPMMLALYTETCAIQKRVQTRDIYPFKPSVTKSELIYNYLLCQVADCELKGRPEEIVPVWCALFGSAAYVAYHMEKDGVFRITKADLLWRLAEYEGDYSIARQGADMPEKLREITKRHVAAQLPERDVLIDRQHLLVEEGGSYTFRHQYFRDFFAALHIANAVRDSLELETFVVLPEVSGNAWSVYVREMLAGFYGDYHHIKMYDSDRHTVLHQLLGRLRGLPYDVGGLAVNNVLETWRGARDGRIVGEDLTGLDLSHVPLNGVVFSDRCGASRFDGCVIADNTFLPQGHRERINSVVYSNDGQRILSASEDGTIKEWNRETGECIQTFEGHAKDVSAATYSTDNHRVLSSSYDKTIKEWDRVSGECIRTFAGHSLPVSSAVYSSGGQRVLSASWDKTIKEWDRNTGECLRTYKDHSADIANAKYNKNETKILSYSDDTTVKEWDRESGTCIYTYKITAGYVRIKHFNSFSNDGRCVLLTHADNVIREWDIEKCTCLQSYVGYSYDVSVAIYSGDEQRVLSLGDSNIIKEWNRATGDCLYTSMLLTPNDQVMHITDSENGKKVLFGTEFGDIIEYDKEAEQRLRSYGHRFTSLYYIDYSLDKRHVRIHFNDGAYGVWDSEIGTCRSIGMSPYNYLKAYSSDDQHVLSTYGNNIIQWDTDTHERIRIYEGHSAYIYCVTYSNDGQRVLSASSDMTIKEWDSATGECLRTFDGHFDFVHTAIYSKDDTRILSASSDRTIKEWDRATGKCIRTFEGHTFTVTSAVYSNDGKHVLSTSMDEIIKQWDRITGMCTHTFEGHSSFVWSAIYSKDDKRILSTSNDSTIKEWNTKTGECLQTYKGHTNGVINARYNKDETKILSYSQDNTVKEWDRKTGKCIWTTPPYSGIYITNSDFKGCRFTSPKIESLIKTYGGKTLSPFLTGIHIKTLFEGTAHEIKLPTPVEIKLGSNTPNHLVITGPNGSGKSALLHAIKSTIDAYLECKAIKTAAENSVHFSGGNPTDSAHTLKQECEKGYYIFEHFPSTNLYDNKNGFWERLDRTKATADELKLKGNHDNATYLESWLKKIKTILQELFATPIRLKYKQGRHLLYHKINDIEHQLNRENLPHGYSAVLNIFSSIFAHWHDITIPLSRMRGLILIDELENHLHIKMQREIFPCLVKIFPHVQFIVATHSPFVWNSFSAQMQMDEDTGSQRDNIVAYDMEKNTVLKGCDDKPLIGWSMDEILNYALKVENTESKVIEAALKDYRKAVDEALKLKPSKRGDSVDKVQKAYSKLDTILSAGNPLRQILKLQMVEFGGVRDDSPNQT